MSWLELDDGILRHPKFIRAIRLAGSEAIHMWLGLRAYCGQLLTDGEIPADMVDAVDGPSGKRARNSALEALISVGLIEKTDVGLRMHDYLDWSRSREEIEAKRQANAKRQRNHRESVPPVTRDKPVTNALVTVSVTTPSPLPSDPLPTTPDQKKSAPVRDEPPAPSPVLVFPCTGQVTEWPLTAAWLEEARAAFPRFDVLADLRKALAKINTGAVGKKTAKGMSRFLMNWLGSTNDKLPAGSKPPDDPRCDWHKDPRNDAKPSMFNKFQCPRCRHFAAARAKRDGPPVDIGELMAAKAAELETQLERERLAQGEKFRQERERDAGVGT